MLTDKNGKNAESLRDKKLYLLDMDGTIYNEDEILRGRLDSWMRLSEGADSTYLSPTIPPSQ